MLFVEHYGVFYKTLRPIARGERRAIRFNDLGKATPSPVTWRHLGRHKFFIQRSKISSNYLNRKTLQGVCGNASGMSSPSAELEHLHHSGCWETAGARPRASTSINSSAISTARCTRKSGSPRETSSSPTSTTTRTIKLMSSSSTYRMRRGS